MFGHEFLPSPEWALGSKYYAIWLGIFIAACASWGAWKLSKTPPDTRLYKFADFYLSRPGYLSREVRKKIGLGLIPIAGFLTGYALITDLVPLSITVALGAKTEHFYTVDRTGVEAGCRSTVYLRDMPFANDRICGLPDWFRISLKPGNVLAVKGVGTGLGIFVDVVRVVGDGAAQSGN
uniref:hypothetical protein n=1 Tax=uncultured Rhizobium sp. TaxID=155567 RepID=UPI00260E9CEC|nr:hypothetical protein [uncultured Rhizobium sp.]